MHPGSDTGKKEATRRTGQYVGELTTRPSNSTFEGDFVLLDVQTTVTKKGCTHAALDIVTDKSAVCGQ